LRKIIHAPQASRRGCKIRLLAPMDADVVLESVPFPARALDRNRRTLLALSRQFADSRFFALVTRAMRAPA